VTLSNPTSSPSVSFIGRHWFALFSLFYGLFVGLPFLAPVLMNIGWTGVGESIYSVYSFFCHQLPQRSFFLFGPKLMLPLDTIQAAWQDTINPMVLRQFIGNSALGWKVAWSDRMISMYTGLLLFAWLWYPFRHRIKPLPLLGLALLSLPMLLDGGSHLISDFAGIGQGFRDSNLWLASLTANSLPASFYSGDAIGSFNSWMRLISGGLFSLGLVWSTFPLFKQSVSRNA
jgi:uncharacterized membrane protein